MDDLRVKIGLTGVVHPNMPGNDRGLYNHIIEAMNVLKDKLDFDLIVVTKPLESEEDGCRAREYLESYKVNFTLIFNSSLGNGRVILPLARINSLLGLWSVPEPTTDGVLQLNSFCGLNMYGSIIAKYFNDYNIPFKWFYGQPDSEKFLERFTITIRALRAIKTVKNARIGLIGGLANGFENMYFDERVLDSRFGTYIQSRYTVEEIVTRSHNIADSRVEKDLDKLFNTGSLNKERVSMKDMEKSSRVFLALKDFAEENNYNALAISCWPRFQEVYGIAVCGAMSRLNESGIVAPCEGDIPGAIDMMICNAINGQKSSLSDLVAFDENDNSINMWHCGVAAGSCSDNSGICWDEHFNIGSYNADKWVGKGVVADLTFKPGQVTIVRMDNNFKNWFIITGEVMSNKKPYYGSSGWINNVKLDGEAIPLFDLMNTIVVNRVDHHYTMTYGNIVNELYEFASWLNMNLLPKVPYKPYLQN